MTKQPNNDEPRDHFGNTEAEATARAKANAKALAETNDSPEAPPFKRKPHFGLTPGDWHNNPFPAPQAIPGTYDLIQRNRVTLIAGAPATGKSTTINHMAVNAAQHNIKTLIIDGEAPETTIQNIKREASHYGLNPDGLIAIMDDETLDDFFEDPRKTLTNELKKYDWDIIIIDSFSSCFGVKDENGNAEISTTMRKIHRLKNRVAIVLIHHTTKDQKTFQITSISGAGAFTRFVDEAYVGRFMVSENAFKIVRVKSRTLGRQNRAYQNFTLDGHTIIPSKSGINQGRKTDKPESKSTQTQLMGQNGTHEKAIA